MKNLVHFQSFKAILVVLIILYSPFVFTQNLLVEGAGSTPVNGYYLLDGTQNGENKYTQDTQPTQTQHTIYWNGINNWYLVSADDPAFPLYLAPPNVEVDNAYPPENTWSSGGKTPGPPPTVSSTPLPVELVSFNALVDGDVVQLNWRTETEVNNYGFDIERSVNPVNGAKSWATIGFVEGHGNSNSPKDYSFVDGDLSGANIIYYRLKQIDNDGTYEYSHEVEVNFVTPDKYTLEQNYPNPFNPSTKIRYKIAESEFVSLVIYNILGKEVVTLVNEVQSPGSYSVVFSADNLPGGVYFFKLETQHFVQTNKMLLLK